uniref:CCHC-type domain-containing protein n=1 Tax=Scleropages formosus TaxID=113540 RepID=A0A8C9RVL1_SCLFO
MDELGFDGFCHPPAVFNLGTSKGYLFYSNQPPFCRVCQGFGHTGANCTNTRCNNCLEKGHMARDCNGPRRCNVCGAEDHLARTCHLRKPTYASQQKCYLIMCQGFGHTGAECTNMRCNNCLEKGHMARDCNGPHTCNICAAEDHLARNCSHRKCDNIIASRPFG